MLLTFGPLVQLLKLYEIRLLIIKVFLFVIGEEEECDEEEERQNVEELDNFPAQ